MQYKKASVCKQILPHLINQCTSSIPHMTKIYPMAVRTPISLVMFLYWLKYFASNRNRFTSRNPDNGHRSFLNTYTSPQNSSATRHTSFFQFPTLYVYVQHRHSDSPEASHQQMCLMNNLRMLHA